MAEHGLTAQQKAWFASVRANLEANTGRSMAQWVEIARTAPDGTFRQKLQWFKAEHGLLQNSASLVLSELEGANAWEDPAAARAALWADPAQAAILGAMEAAVAELEGVVTGQRKGFTAWSRKSQFAALKPVKARGARLGLALGPDADPRLVAAGKESWSERLKAALPLGSADEVDAGVRARLRAAWERS